MSQQPMSKNKKLMIYLIFGCIGMFGFGFALVPLYNVMCKQLGINGHSSNIPEKYKKELVVDKSRNIKVEFVTQIHPGLPYDFGAITKEVTVHPGELAHAKFYARNNSHHLIVSQAIPSISPGQGTLYFHKTECFCFTQQPLKAQTSADLPVVFFIDPALPKDIHTITLSYTLYDVTKAVLEAHPEVAKQVES
ncbi:cytochrome c oxidase assembly protein [Parashewanella tropica]|uniref:cytochrome c oxidase assembly protein n=1 Tax=Parashewanella tropica TaxID=2547970 RepID=UPI00105A8ACC|nr:cytochrome c oxidase assembly protein [Parashewanella tropica]